MILTVNHLKFYQAKKTPVPGWAATITKPVPEVSIHELINVQVPEYKRTKTEPNNLIHIIRCVQRHRQETVQSLLARIAYTPHVTDTKRRSGYAKKWLRKLVVRQYQER